ncbi:hypothetical protein [Nocardia thailandica]|uniref:Potassium/proton antiporter subunit KhtT-like N-terminal domain-containing protein n=1 Tax=Nocardia thailandica TaxID=257275 RepID=A0ABW6PLF4_9NOCA|nr:hypothetical protein [Nocardia thailandica]
MDTDRATVPGQAVIHRCRTRSGDLITLLTERSGRRQLLVTAGDEDEPAAAITLDPDEADELADLLRRRSTADRLAHLERRVDALATGRDRP